MASLGMVMTNQKVPSPLTFVASTSNYCSASFTMALAPAALVESSCWRPGFSLDIDIPTSWLMSSLILTLLCDADEQGVINTLQGEDDSIDDEDEYVGFELDAETAAGVMYQWRCTMLTRVFGSACRSAPRFQKPSPATRFKSNSCEVTVCAM